jgi:hypothetical protein
MVQIGIVETGGFYEVVADHGKERPAKGAGHQGCAGDQSP